jgi:hypothetical protein
MVKKVGNIVSSSDVSDSSPNPSTSAQKTEKQIVLMIAILAGFITPLMVQQ